MCVILYGLCCPGQNEDICPSIKKSMPDLIALPRSTMDWSLPSETNDNFLGELETDDIFLALRLLMESERNL